MNKGQWLWAFIFLIIFIFLGGIRDIVFVNINEQIAYNNGLINSYRVLESFAFLQDLGNSRLGVLKWILTVIFAALYLLLSLLCMHRVLRDRKGLSWMAYTYGLGLCIAAALYLGGKLLGDSETGYTLSRVVMGALQSPFPLMLMIPARMLSS